MSSGSDSIMLNDYSFFVIWLWSITVAINAAIPLSIDHKPDRSDERERIEQAGGFIIWAGKSLLQSLFMCFLVLDWTSKCTGDWSHEELYYSTFFFICNQILSFFLSGSVHFHTESSKTTLSSPCKLHYLWSLSFTKNCYSIIVCSWARRIYYVTV